MNLPATNTGTGDNHFVISDPLYKGNSLQNSLGRMEAVRWIPKQVKALLDVGCNVGALLCHCGELFPGARLAGVDVNSAALQQARVCLPGADLQHATAERLPYPDESFDCVTMIEVLEHVPVDLRRRSLAEVRRVLSPGGVAIIRVPHAGLFAWLDPNNFRFRAPALYRWLIGSGRRDTGCGGSGSVVWHHHFSRCELLDLAGEGWTLEQCCMGGLMLVPFMDLCCWPFYRTGWTNNRFYRALERIAAIDLRCNYGRLSYSVLLILRRT
jgi:SAM-dependent methyltransferase